MPKVKKDRWRMRSSGQMAAHTVDAMRFASASLLGRRATPEQQCLLLGGYLCTYMHVSWGFRLGDLGRKLTAYSAHIDTHDKQSSS